ncbi:MAG: hypothetical protein K6U09_04305 [Acidobacteriia bacterium]|jgi:hypothetical protein|nr:hypothetical protein [Terriglobia bacterium]
MDQRRAYCYYCGVPLTEVEQVMASFTPGYQCRHCWNRMRVTADPGWPPPKTVPKIAQQPHRSKRSAA